MIDPQASSQAESDLEQQVDGLLSDAMESIESIGEALDDAQESVGVPSSEDTSPEPTVTADDVQAVLEDAIGEDEHPGVADDVAPDDEDAGTDDAVAARDDDEATTASDPSGEDGIDASFDSYGDQDSLDDELAALACDAFDDSDADEPISPPELETEPVEAGTDLADAPPPGEQEADQGSPGPIADDVAPAGEPASDKSGVVAQEDGDGSRALGGWLPPKPDWPEVYGRARPAIVAWRHAVWVAPPLGALVWRWFRRVPLPRVAALLARGEPRLRQGVTFIASPLAKRDRNVRSAVGWLAIWTLFWSVCLWVYVVAGRSPVAPEPASSPTHLAGEVDGDAAETVAMD